MNFFSIFGKLFALTLLHFLGTFFLDPTDKVVGLIFF
jgi:hypothetical protein